jgi:transmembrane sensor
MSPAQGTADVARGRLLEAAEWLTRLRELEELSSADLRAWQQFIASPENRQAFETMQRIASATVTLARPPLPSAAELSDDTYDGTVSVSRWQTQRALREYDGPATQRRTWRSRWMLSAAAVAFLLVLALTVLPFHWISAPQAFRTQPGEHRVLTLKDGSTVALGAKTVIEVQYDGGRREVRLQQGEALFTVAHDRSHPFVVQVGGGTVTAVGTEFNVWSNLDRTTVTVTEGAVDVKPVQLSQASESAASKLGAASRVHKGQEVTYDEEGRRTQVQPADVASATAWRDGRLVYRHVPLKYVISDVNRYFHQQLKLEDPKVGELEFSGAVPQGLSAIDFARALERIFPLESIELDDRSIVIRRRTSTADKEPLVKS